MSSLNLHIGAELVRQAELSCGFTSAAECPDDYCFVHHRDEEDSCQYCGKDSCDCESLHSCTVDEAPQVTRVVACRNKDNPGELDLVDVEAGSVIFKAHSMSQVRRISAQKGWELISDRIADAMGEDADV